MNKNVRKDKKYKVWGITNKLRKIEENNLEQYNKE